VNGENVGYYCAFWWSMNAEWLDVLPHSRSYISGCNYYAMYLMEAVCTSFFNIFFVNVIQ